ALGGGAARADLRPRPHRPARAPQRRDRVAGQHDHKQRSADGRASRSHRRRERRLDRLLWFDRTWRYRAWCRPPAQTKAKGLWTCGQREEALPTGSTGPTTTADLNKTGNGLPTSPVRTLTHAPGCSACGSGRVSRDAMGGRLLFPSAENGSKERRARQARTLEAGGTVQRTSTALT